MCEAKDHGGYRCPSSSPAPRRAKYAQQKVAGATRTQLTKLANSRSAEVKEAAQQRLQQLNSDD